MLGMISLTVSTLIVYPYRRGKVLLQITDNSSNKIGSEHDTSTNSDPSGEKTPRNHVSKPSIPTMIGQQFSHGGLTSVYQGIGPQLLRGVLSAALMMMVKEKIGAVVEAAVLSAGKEKGATAGHGRRRPRGR